MLECVSFKYLNNLCDFCGLSFLYNIVFLKIVCFGFWFSNLELLNCGVSDFLLGVCVLVVEDNDFFLVKFLFEELLLILYKLF